jgi:type I restriction enzyme S subunit
MELFRFGEIADTASGGTPSRGNKQFYIGDIPWVKSGELNDNYIYDTEEKINQQAIDCSSAKIFPKGTLLMAMYGATAGKTAMLKIDAATNQAVCAIFPKEDKAIKEFLKYYLVYIRPMILSRRFGGAQPNISQTIINNLEVNLPPLQEQKAIAYILFQIQVAIEAQEVIIKTTIELKNTLINDLFAKGLRREKQKQTDIGMIPESWSVSTLNDIIDGEMKNGAFVHKPKLGSGILYVNVVDIYENPIIDYSKLERINIDKSKIQNYLLQENDIVFVRSSLKRDGIAELFFDFVSKTRRSCVQLPALRLTLS